MKVGVIRTEGEIFGERVVSAARRYGGHDVQSIVVPKDLPLFTDEPETYLRDESVFESDLIFACVFFREPNYPYSTRAHPDLTWYVAERCEECGVELIAPRAEKLFLGKAYEVRIAAVEIGCELKRYEGGFIGNYTEKFGRPEFEVTIRDGVVEKVEVKRGAPCGATWEVAKKIVGENVSNAPRKTAILQQHYCTAPSSYDIFTGRERGLHKAGELHLKAMEDAIESYKRIKP